MAAATASHASTSAPVRAQWKQLLSVEENRGKGVLHLKFTLTNGQAFGWRANEEGDKTSSTGTGSAEEREAQWTGVIQSSVVSLRHVGDAVQFFLHNPAPEDTTGSTIAMESGRNTDIIPLLRDYFQLDIDLDRLRVEWSRKDARMAQIASHLRGMRVLRQDPWECLVSFICSSNNNIARITGMLERLRQAYGTCLCHVDGRPYHSFPSPTVLASVPDTALRQLGFGYRAPFVIRTAAQVLEAGGEPALTSWRTLERRAVVEKLMAFHGVGRKVADCVALFSLDQPDCIPVDTHVLAIAQRYMDRSLQQAKSLTDKIYENIGDLFRSAYVECAGWAHSLLFAAELPAFRVHLPPDLCAKMAELVAEEKAAKAAVRAEKAAARGIKQQPPTTPKTDTAAVAGVVSAASAAAAAGALNSETESDHPVASPPKRPRKR